MSIPVEAGGSEQQRPSVPGGASPPDRDHAGDRLPAPLSIVLLLLAGWGLQGRWPLPALEGGPRWIGGIALVLFGLAIGFPALALMRRARTSPVPFHPTTALVTEGIYRWTRNPMYLGMVFIFAGLAILVAVTWGLVLIPVFVVLVHFGAILPEERYLERRFGDAYREYRRRVRAWI